MSSQWFIARGGQKHGPYSFDQLQHWAKFRILLPTEMVLEGGSSKWTPAEAVVGLFAAPVADIAVPPLPVSSQADLPTPSTQITAQMPNEVPVATVAEQQAEPAWSSHRSKHAVLGGIVALVFLLCVGFVINHIMKVREQNRLNSLGIKADGKPDSSDDNPRKCLDGWLASMKSGDTGEEYWAGTRYTRLFSVRSGEVLKVSVMGETASAKVRIDSSNKGGSPITVTWEVSLAKENGMWKITAIRNPDAPDEPKSDASPSPLPVTPPTENTITLKQYESLKTGMTLAQVEKVLGNGKEMSRTELGGVVSVSYSWKNPDGSNIFVIFSDNKLISKAQFGLK